MEHTILFAGFGGQGILFSGKFLTYAGLMEGNQVTWLPSYGPEMRGGTANCSVVLSDTPVGSPVVNNPQYLVVMNGPSYDKFENAVQPGGLVVVDSSLIAREPGRTDIQTVSIPAPNLASEKGLDGLANMIILGKLLAHASLCKQETLAAAMAKVVPERKRALLEKNLEAITLGLSYEG